MPSLPFPNRLESQDMLPIRSVMERFAAESSLGEGLSLIELRRVHDNEKRYLRERNVITPEMEGSEYAMVAVGRHGDFIILINEEDHFRIQVIRPGLQFTEAYRMADAIDSELNRFVPYAFSDEIGYLTSCTSNLGTGLRVSALLHLPVVTMKNRVQDMVPEEKRHYVEIRGTAGRPNRPMGCIYQLASRVALGISEVDIIEIADEVLARIIDIEDSLRDELYSENRLELEDSVCRSFGILSCARRLSYVEAMEHLSGVRLGVILAIIKNTEIQAVNDMMVSSQWAHLQQHYGIVFKNAAECDEYRADYLRNNLKNSGVE
jgi:protein arginine kinase